MAQEAQTFPSPIAVPDRISHKTLLFPSHPSRICLAIISNRNVRFEPASRIYIRFLLPAIPNEYELENLVLDPLARFDTDFEIFEARQIGRFCIIFAFSAHFMRNTPKSDEICRSDINDFMLSS